MNNLGLSSSLIAWCYICVCQELLQKRSESLLSQIQANDQIDTHSGVWHGPWHETWGMGHRSSSIATNVGVHNIRVTSKDNVCDPLGENQPYSPLACGCFFKRGSHNIYIIHYMYISSLVVTQCYWPTGHPTYHHVRSVYTGLGSDQLKGAV